MAEASVERRFGRAGVQGGVLFYRFCGKRVNRIIDKAIKIVEFTIFSAKSLMLVKPFHTSLSQPVRKDAHALGWDYLLNSHHQ